MDQYNNCNRNELVELLLHEQSQNATAGQMGKDLLKQLSNTKEKATRLEQECFTLQRQIELKISMEANYQEEIDSLQDSLNSMKEKLVEAEQTSHLNCRERSDELQTALDCAVEELTIREADLSSVNTQLAEVTASLHALELANQQRLEVSSFAESSVLESAGIISQLQTTVDELMTRCGHLENTKLQTDEELAQLREANEIKDSKVEQYFTGLQEAREEITALIAEKEALRIENATPGQQGNSLFGELEDRRTKAESQLVSLRNSYQQLEVRYQRKLGEFEQFKDTYLDDRDKQHRNRDVSYIESLKATNHELLAENESLKYKLAKNERSLENEQQGIADTLRAFRKSSNWCSEFDVILKMKDHEINQLRADLKQAQDERMNLKASQVACNKKRFELQCDLDTTKSAMARMDFQMSNMKEELELLRDGGQLPDSRHVSSSRPSSILCPLMNTKDSPTAHVLPTMADGNSQEATAPPPKFIHPASSLPGSGRQWRKTSSAVDAAPGGPQRSKDKENDNCSPS